MEEPKHDDDNSIDDVDEDKIDEILRDATRNLVIFFCESFFFSKGSQTVV